MPDARDRPLRVAIAHEWLVSYAGSERCVVELLEAFPGAELLTTLVEPSRLPPSLGAARPSLLQHVPGARAHHQWFLPLMPLAWRLREPVADVELVISSSHACAKGVRIDPGIPHLCYCHTPMRYAWDFDAERERFPRPIRPLARVGMAWLRRWDRLSAERVTRFVANSSAVARRIERVFGRSAQVIHPPVRTDFFTPGGTRSEAFLFVGRLVAYKRPELVVDAFAGLPGMELLVVGDGPLRPRLAARASANVSFLGEVDDETLRGLYRSARALVYPAEEDFGIVMAEAQACGTPVIGLDRGGALDIVTPGLTGWLIADQSLGELRGAIRRAARECLDSEAIVASAARFSAGRFRAELQDVAWDCVEAER